jgi:glycosyltransferase involved in cell wall biosynthesis
MMVRASLWRAELIMPTSQHGVQHIARRFGIPREKLMAVSWGADLAMFRPAAGERRRVICGRWGIPADAKVLLNVRRLRKQWGSLDVFEAFLRLAQRTEGTHFVMLGGEGTESIAQECRKRIDQANLGCRFTIIDGAISIEEVADLMSIAAIYTSVMGSGDMRSLSVVQAAAAGGAPVLGEHPEYSNMERQGFRTLFAARNDPDSIVAALSRYLDDERLRQRTVESNLAYIAQHEDESLQMDRLLGNILCRLDRPSKASSPYMPSISTPRHAVETSGVNS